MGKPKQRKRNESADAMDYVLTISQVSGKRQPEAPKGSYQPMGGCTKINAWNDTCTAYKQLLILDDAKSVRVIVVLFHIFEHLLGKG